MSIFSSKLNNIAKNTNSYLKSYFANQRNNSYLLKPMKYGVFSGGKRFRSAVVVNSGKIFNIDIDTTHFNGNQPTHASIEGCFSKTTILSWLLTNLLPFDPISHVTIKCPPLVQLKCGSSCNL